MKKFVCESIYNFIQIGQNELIMGNYQDITERKMSEKALIESEERYRTLVDQSPNPVMVASLDGKLTYLNLATLRAFKIFNEELLLDTNIMDIIHPDYRAMVQGRLERIAMGIGNEPAEIKLQMSGGKNCLRNVVEHSHNVIGRTSSTNRVPGYYRLQKR